MNRLTPTAQRLLDAHPHVASWFTDSDGVWARLRPGWEYDSLHSIHIEWCDYRLPTLRAVLRDITPCRCPDCAAAAMLLALGRGQDWAPLAAAHPRLAHELHDAGLVQWAGQRWTLTPAGRDTCDTWEDDR